jgi:hypothetical protein
MRFLKQSTSVDVGIGPFLDETDGKTAETALTITQPDIRLKKNGGAWAQKNAAQTLTHEEAGWYEVTLDATDTDTVGILIVAIHESGALPVWEVFHVLEEAIYDALIAASAAAFDANQDVTVGGFAANAITAAAIASDAITAAKIAADAITAAKIATGAIDADAIADNAIDAGAIAAGALNGKGDWNIGKTGYALSAGGVQAIWDALTAALTTAGSVGKLIVDNLNATVSSRASQTSLDTLDDFVDTEVAAILEDTGTTLDDLVDDLEGRLTAALATALQAHALGIGRGVVDVGSTTTAVVFELVNGATPSAVNDFYNGRHIIFTSGALTLQATSITDYDGTTKTATVPTLTGAPADDVTFIIV